VLAMMGRVMDARVQIAAARALAADDPHLYLAEGTVRLAQRRPPQKRPLARRSPAASCRNSPT
jgi:hypothetical protein